MGGARLPSLEVLALPSGAKRSMRFTTLGAVPGRGTRRAARLGVADPLKHQ